MWCSFSRRSRSVPPLHKAARPGTRDSVSRCSVALHTASHRLAERNRYVALRSLFMSGLDLVDGGSTPVTSPAAPGLPISLRYIPASAGRTEVRLLRNKPARLSRGNVRATLHYSQDSVRAGKTGISRSSFCASGSCRGLRPCPLCHLCPATATVAAVAASGPKQHRPSDERPLQPRCEFQRHHPPEGSCRIYIFVLWAQSCCRTPAFLCDTLSSTLYIIDNLPLFEYLYSGFDGTVTALIFCLNILQDTSELPMCLRLVAPIPF